MYVLQIKFYSEWKWGVVRYNSIEDAEKRVKELAKVGIKARIRLISELFGSK